MKPEPWDGTVDVSVISDETGVPMQRLLTSTEAVRYLRLSTMSLWRLTQSGEITPIHFGRAVRFDLRDLDAWVARMRAQQGLAV